MTFDTTILHNSKQTVNQINSVSLSTAHNRPRVSYYQGASYFKTIKGADVKQTGGGKRGAISGFSKQSRRRLMQLIAKVQRSADLPHFVTLTYPHRFPDVAEAKRDLKVFMQRLKREYPHLGGIWKLEPQQRGAPHYHMLVWGEVGTRELLRWVASNWYDIAGNGDENHRRFHMGWLHDAQPCVAKVYSFRGVWSYASKYIGKTFEVAQWGNKWTGRFWGTWNTSFIPFGREIIYLLDYRTVVQLQRYQRRFAKIRKTARNTLTTFCDADQWVNRLLCPGSGGHRSHALAAQPGHRRQAQQSRVALFATCAALDGVSGFG